MMASTMNTTVTAVSRSALFFNHYVDHLSRNVDELLKRLSFDPFLDGRIFENRFFYLLFRCAHIEVYLSAFFAVHRNGIVERSFDKIFSFEFWKRRIEYG